MALIHCGHCGHIISDRAKRCPHCGAAVGMLSTSRLPYCSTRSHRGNMKWLWVALIGLGVAAVVLLVILLAKGANTSDSDTSTPDAVAEQVEQNETDVRTLQELNETDVRTLQELEEPEAEVARNNFEPYEIEGNINSQYPVMGTITLRNGEITGRYCYKSVYNKYGDRPSTWITLYGSYDDGDAYLTGHYYNNVADDEQWCGRLYENGRGIRFSGQYYSRDGNTYYMDFHSI